MTATQESTGRSGVRIASAVVHAGFAALAVALLAWPARLWLEGLGLLRPAEPWRVPLGALCALLVLVIAAFTLRFALVLASGARPRVPEHVAFLLAVAVALLVRSLAGTPAPPERKPVLEAGLRAAAEALERGYAARGSYVADAAALESALAALPPTSYVLRGRPLRLRAVPLENASGPQLLPLPADSLPGTIYVAIGKDAQRAWLTVVELRAGGPALLLAAPHGSDSRTPLVLLSRGGTHGPLGRDSLLPSYPGAHSTSQPVQGARRER